MKGLLVPLLPALLALPLNAGHAAGGRLDDTAFQRAGFDPRPGERVPADLRLTDSDGRAVTLGGLTGERPAVLALAYHDCPNLCGLTIGGLLRSVEALELQPGRDFEVLVVSFDPREGPAKAAAARREAARRLGTNGGGEMEGWHFLTGSAAQIGRLTRAVGFRYAWDEALEQYAHPAGLVVLGPDGTISRYLYGVRYAPLDLRLGLVDAGRGRVGGLTDQVLLLCYRYDPVTGRYGGLVMAALRVSGVALLFGLGAFLGRALWRDQRGRGGRA